MTDQTHAAQAAQVAQSPAEEANPKTLTASVLLAAPHWDPAAFAADFEGDWGVKVEGVPSNPGEPLAFRAMGSIIVVGMNPCEIPDRMAEAPQRLPHTTRPSDSLRRPWCFGSLGVPVRQNVNCSVSYSGNAAPGFNSARIPPFSGLLGLVRE